MSIKILDCTLRDGGYYNKWEFDRDLVNDYLNAVAHAGVSYVELGLRQFKNSEYFGPHAFSTHQYINRLSLPEGPIYGVMIDAKTVLSEKLNNEECIDALFKDSKDEEISFVRIAAHFDEVKLCQPMVNKLKEKGYIVGLNIMQVSMRSSNEIESLSFLIKDWDNIDVLYFADSLGSMSCDDVKSVFSSLRKNWKKDIGFHAHNNMGQAIANVNTAIDLGCTWIDGTISGMGRGAGNAPTEYLFLEPKININNYDPSSLNNLVNKYFKKMKNDYGWGESVPYYIGALKNIHPTYVQELHIDPTVNPELIPKILLDISKTEKPNIYNKEILNTVKSKINVEKHKNKIDGTNITNFMSDKEVLLIAQTDLSIKYKEAIDDYIKAKSPIVISINQPLKDLNFDYDFIGISHNEKFREDEINYSKNSYEYIAPKALFKETKINIEHDYGIELVEGRFKSYASFAQIPYRLTIGYIIAFCISAKAEKINLVGCGGYDLDDPRQKEMQDFLKILSKETINLVSLTPTTFTIPEESIYAI